MVKNSSSGEKTHSEEIEHDRPGSVYVELDLTSDADAQRIGAYYIELIGRYDDWAQNESRWRAPELPPSPIEIEKYLLKSLIRQGGKVNFWDISIELAQPDNTLSEEFEKACENFINGLGLELKKVE